MRKQILALLHEHGEDDVTLYQKDRIAEAAE